MVIADAVLNSSDHLTNKRLNICHCFLWQFSVDSVPDAFVFDVTGVGEQFHGPYA